MKQRFLIGFLVLLFVLPGCNRHSPNAAGPSASPQGSAAKARMTGTGFDFYLLNLSWSPEYCHSHPGAAECAAHSTFVLHGLWPENANGSYPENCSNAPGPADPAQYKDIYPDPSLLQHEWQTHGTCSGLSPDDFFSLARSAYHSVAVPPTFSALTSQISMPPDQILGLFTAANSAIPRSSLLLTCGNNYLTAVEVCMDKSLRPTSCGALHTCGATTVRIPPP